MSIISKVLGALMMKSGIAYSAPVFHRLLLNVLAVLALTIMLGIMVGALFCFILFLIYCGLISIGFGPIYSSLSIIAIFLVVIGVIVYRLCGFRDIIKRSLYEAVSVQTPVIGKANEIFQSFLSGLMQKNPNK